MEYLKIFRSDQSMRPRLRLCFLRDARMSKVIGIFLNSGSAGWHAYQLD